MEARIGFPLHWLALALFLNLALVLVLALDNDLAATRRSVLPKPGLRPASSKGALHIERAQIVRGNS